MSLSKYYKKYASGGNFKNRQVSDGLRAMQIQSDNITRALEKRKAEEQLQGKTLVTDLTSKASKEAKARETLYKLEVEAPRKLKAEALKRNNKTQQESLKRQADEYRKQSQVWSSLAPTLSKSFSKLANSAETYFNTTNAIAEFNRMDASGEVGSMMEVYGKVLDKADLLSFSQQRAKAYQDYVRTGNANDKQLFNYLTDVNELKNPVLKDIIFQDLKKNFDGIETDFLTFLQNNKIELNKNTVLSHYQFRALEFLRQYNIDPNSEIGFKVQRLFKAKGAVKENQFTLGHEYEKHKNVIAQSVDRIKALSGEAFSSSDFSTMTQYENVKKTMEKRKNAIWIDTVASLNAIPLLSREGQYKQQVTPNTRANIVGWAKEQIKDYDDLTQYMEEIFGVTVSNPDGYLIPGADKDTPRNRILGKFPNLRAEMEEEFAEQYREKRRTQETLAKATHNAKALTYQQKLDDGYYKENPDEFWADWKASNGNPAARQVFAGSLGFKSKYIDEGTLTSTIVQNYKAGNLSEVYSAWAGLPDEEQEIGFIIKDLKELAEVKGLTVTKGKNSLDNYLKELTQAQIDLVTSKGATDKLEHPTVQGVSEQALGFLLEEFRNNQSGSVSDRFDQAKAALEVKLGIVNGIPTPFDENGLRGSGEFLQKQGKSGATNQIIFVKNAGENFGNLSAFEIDLTLGDSKGSDRLTKLTSVVFDDVESNTPTVSDRDIYSLLKTGTTTNRLLKHLMKENVLGGVTKTDFINTIKNTVQTTAENKKLVRQWGGEEWCNHMLGAYSGTLSNDQKAIGVCVKYIENQFETPAWEFLLNPSLQDRLQL